MNISEKVRRWLLYSVLGSCLPFVEQLAGPLVLGGSFPGWGIVTERGDLYLVGTTLCAAALGELSGAPESKKGLKQSANFAGIVLFFVCGSFYALASTNFASLAAPKAIWVQIITYAMSVVSSIVCIIASEAR